MTPDNQPTGIRLPVFALAAVFIVVGAFVAVWVAIPGPDTSHSLVAPSGQKAIELAELCTPNGCNRVAILDVTQPDGSHVRTGCPLPIEGASPIFSGITASWSEAEDAVELANVDFEAGRGSLILDLADCTLTQ